MSRMAHSARGSKGSEAPAPRDPRVVLGNATRSVLWVFFNPHENRSIPGFYSTLTDRSGARVNFDLAIISRKVEALPCTLANGPINKPAWVTQYPAQRAPMNKTSCFHTHERQVRLLLIGSPMAQRPQERRGSGPRTRRADTDERDGELERRTELLTQYTPLVRSIALRFHKRVPCNVLRDDLVAAGMSGLWSAIRRQGTEQGDAFEWYLRVRVRGAIVDELRAQDWLPRRERARANRERDMAGAPASTRGVVRIDDIGASERERTLAMNDPATDAEEVLLQRMDRARLRHVVALLPERERDIVLMHYFSGMRFKELGQRLGVSEPRISQLHSRAVGRLRALLAGDEAAA
jgi:RNA polymerase sigma factor FliA